MKPEHIIMGLTAAVSLVTLIKMIRGAGTTAGVEEAQIKALVDGFEALRADIRTMSHARLLPLEKDVAVLKERVDEAGRRLQALETHPGRRG
ncbi:MAG: hypothetical protein EPN98_21560 [Phenylobacterium sp.]|uniref:hypothetical protein n=1 Tax=Phenylobacterium sp. TaxID=1871053 RepID=UPI0011FA40B6|nr:hypothetical protein [Phenylobacterium sp.]TAL29032.1 MAG: hypothetical protein EPN98_21560 [Phenylobacterium sp.]